MLYKFTTFKSKAKQSMVKLCLLHYALLKTFTKTLGWEKFCVDSYKIELHGIIVLINSITKKLLFHTKFVFMSCYKPIR